MFTEFAGPLLKKELSDDTLIEIMHSIHLLIAKKSIYLEWGAQGKQAWGNVLDIFGYLSIRRPTLLIDLNNNESEIWASFTSRARNMIRKAEKSGVLTQRIYPDESWIAKYYEMLQANFLRQNIKVPHPYSFYQQIKALSRDEIAMCFNAEVNGEMVAAGIFLVDTNRLLYFSGVTSELGMKLAASSLVQWHAIKEAIQMDISKYDMGGLGVESIDRFKRSFGGYDYFHYRYIRQSKFLKLLEPLIYWTLRKGYLKFTGV
jgi:lipid II:glycine glycyltransferase (peptidoglycan interpeptide bridge formation enzyme)